MIKLTFARCTYSYSAEHRNALTSLLGHFVQPKWLAAEIGGCSASQL